MSGGDFNMELKKALQAGNKRIGVWGVGHIGYSTMSNFAERGVKCLGYDVDAKKVAQINQGEIPIFAMDYWLGFDPKFLYLQGIAGATPPAIHPRPLSRSRAGQRRGEPTRYVH